MGDPIVRIFTWDRSLGEKGLKFEWQVFIATKKLSGIADFETCH
jgi:hypothetical protein